MYDDKVQNIQNKCPRKIRDHILDKKNVHSVGIGFKEKNGDSTDEVCVVVGVSEKEELSKLESEDIVPPVLKGISTDVQERSIPSFGDENIESDGNPGNDGSLQRRVRDNLFEILSGGLTGHAGGYGTVPGTAGFIDEDGDLVTLTARHIACDEDEDCSGDDVYQPSGYTHSMDDRVVGEVKKLGPFEEDGPYDENLDVASVKMDEEVATVSDRYYGIGKQLDNQPPSLGEMVVNTGSRSGLTSSKIAAIDVTSFINYSHGSIVQTGLFEYERGDDVVSAGDSGSVTGYVNEEGDMNPVGIHIASDDTYASAIPMGKIEDTFGELSTVEGNFGFPVSSWRVELFETTCYDLAYDGDTEEIIVKYLVSNTGGENFSDTVELTDSEDNILASESYSDILPGRFTVDEFRIPDSYNNELLTLKTSDHHDIIEPDGVEDNYVPTITLTNSPITEGDRLRVGFDVSNKDGNYASDESVELIVDGSVEEVKDIAGFAKDTKSYSFVYDTHSSDVGTFDVSVRTVQSDNTDTQSVEVNSASPDAIYEYDIFSTNSPVPAGDELNVDCRITNVGNGDGYKEVNFSVSDYSETKNVFVAENDSEIVRFTWNTVPSDIGNYTATVGGVDGSDSISVEVKEVENSFFKITNIDTNSPVKPGSVISVDFTVKNIGGRAGSEDIVLYIDNVLEGEEENVELAPEETFSSSFDWQTPEETNTFSGWLSSSDDSLSFDLSTEVDLEPYTPVESDWDDNAIENKSTTLASKSYNVFIYDNDHRNELTLPIDNISYSPEVNSSPKMTIDVEPKEDLETEKYIGGTLEVFVDKKKLFVGDIFKLTSNRKEGNFYTIEAENPGKKLRNEVIDETTDNDILSDYMANIVDKYNEWDDEHKNLIGTDSEILSGIDEEGKARAALTDNASCLYENVGPDASELELLYFKIKTNDPVYVNVHMDGTTYEESFIDISTDGTYGDWKKVKFSELDSTSYDLEFILQEGATLYDWITLTEDILTRDVEPEIAEPMAQNEVVQTAHDQTTFEELLDGHIEDSDPFKLESGEIVPLQTSFTFEASSTISGLRNVSSFEDSDLYSDGEAYGLGGSSGEVGDVLTYTFTPEYDIPASELWTRYEAIPDSDGDEIYLPGMQMVVDGIVVESYADGAGVIEKGEPDWRREGLKGTLNAGDTIEIKYEITSMDLDFSDISDADDYSTYYVDVVNLHDERFEVNMDNDVHEPAGYLDGPELYPQTDTGTFQPPSLRMPWVSTGENIDRAYASIEGSKSEDIHRIYIQYESPTYWFLTDEWYNSIAISSQIITSTVRTRLETIGIQPEGPRNETPRMGYDNTPISAYELAIDTNSIEILFEEDIQDNRLKALSDIADNSRPFYRWNGSECDIFPRGSKKTNVDLREEEVETSISIENTYTSCEVIGEGGVSSGIVEADDAPEFIDRHKEIKDPDIKTEYDAMRRARSFIANNSSIEYEASITTLPTLAPLGEEFTNDVMPFDEEMIIESVRYGKNRTDIDFGRKRKFEREFVDVERGIESSRKRGITGE